MRKTMSYGLGAELVAACEKGSERRACQLLEEPVYFYVDYTDVYGNTPLWYACQRGLDKVVRLLLDKGASLNCKGNLGRTPLAIACLEGKNQCAQELVENGARAEMCKMCNSITMLMRLLEFKVVLTNISIPEGTDRSRDAPTQLLKYFFLWAGGNPKVIEKKKPSDHHNLLPDPIFNAELSNFYEVGFTRRKNNHYFGGSILNWMRYTNFVFPSLEILCRCS